MLVLEMAILQMVWLLRGLLHHLLLSVSVSDEKATSKWWIPLVALAALAEMTLTFLKI